MGECKESSEQNATTNTMLNSLCPLLNSYPHTIGAAATSNGATLVDGK